MTTHRTRRTPPARKPRTDLAEAYSEPDAPATDWAAAREELARAEVFWLTTVRPDGRPHVTPLLGVLSDDALHFCTGPEERKARNLTGNARVALVTGSNSLHGGLDLVVEGEAVRVTDDAELRRLAGLYEAKYGSDWRFEAHGGLFHHTHGGGRALVFRVTPVTAFGFAKAPYSQTRWRF